MPLEIELDYDRGVPIYRQITEAILAALSTGQLARNEQLPTIHELAARLGVNPNTVARSYRDLLKDGHIVAKRGKGTFPALEPPEPVDRDKTLRDLYDRFVTEAARVGIGIAELVSYFSQQIESVKETPDDRD
jgi:DNA-binding transcriptional regulator YhcF (GntR family)